MRPPAVECSRCVHAVLVSVALQCLGAACIAHCCQNARVRELGCEGGKEQGSWALRGATHGIRWHEQGLLGAGCAELLDQVGVVLHHLLHHGVACGCRRARAAPAGRGVRKGDRCSCMHACVRPRPGLQGAAPLLTGLTATYAADMGLSAVLPSTGHASSPGCLAPCLLCPPGHDTWRGAGAKRGRWAAGLTRNLAQRRSEGWEVVLECHLCMCACSTRVQRRVRQAAVFRRARKQAGQGARFAG
jgi:hypothetical protein